MHINVFAICIKMVGMAEMLGTKKVPLHTVTNDGDKKNEKKSATTRNGYNEFAIKSKLKLFRFYF